MKYNSSMQPSDWELKHILESTVTTRKDACNLLARNERFGLWPTVLALGRFRVRKAVFSHPCWTVAHQEEVLTDLGSSIRRSYGGGRDSAQYLGPALEQLGRAGKIKECESLHRLLLETLEQAFKKPSGRYGSAIAVSCIGYIDASPSLLQYLATAARIGEMSDIVTHDNATLAVWTTALSRFRRPIFLSDMTRVARIRNNTDIRTFVFENLTDHSLSHTAFRFLAAGSKKESEVIHYTRKFLEIDPDNLPALLEVLSPTQKAFLTPDILQPCLSSKDDESRRSAIRLIGELRSNSKSI